MKEPTHPDRIQADARLRVKAIRLCILPLCKLALIEKTYIFLRDCVTRLESPESGIIFKGLVLT
jgi:hypothetical protein